MSEINMKEAWKKLRMGEPTTDAELLALHQQTNRAMEYFDDRGIEMHLAAVETIRIKSDIEGYLSARGFRVFFDDTIKRIVIGERRNARL